MDSLTYHYDPRAQKVVAKDAVVLDPSDPTVEHFVSQWRGASGVGWHGAAGDLCRLIEAQTRPTIEEPTEGTLAKVTANTLKSASVIFAEWTRGKWRHANGEPVNFGPGGVRVVEIVREGVQP